MHVCVCVCVCVRVSVYVYSLCVCVFMYGASEVCFNVNGDQRQISPVWGRHLVYGVMDQLLRSSERQSIPTNHNKKIYAVLIASLLFLSWTKSLDGWSYVANRAFCFCCWLICLFILIREKPDEDIAFSNAACLCWHKKKSWFDRQCQLTIKRKLASLSKIPQMHQRSLASLAIMCDPSSAICPMSIADFKATWWAWIDQWIRLPIMIPMATALGPVLWRGPTRHDELGDTSLTGPSQHVLQRQGEHGALRCSSPRKVSPSRFFVQNGC